MLSWLTWHSKIPLHQRGRRFVSGSEQLAGSLDTLPEGERLVCFSIINLLLATDIASQRNMSWLNSLLGSRLPPRSHPRSRYPHVQQPARPLMLPSNATLQDLTLHGIVTSRGDLLGKPPRRT